MISVEDRIRGAIRAAGDAVHEVRPLRLPESGTPRGLRSAARVRRSRLWRTWIVPVTAAAAVLAIGITLATVRYIPNGGVVSPSLSASVPPQPTSRPEPTIPASVAALPRYYVALSDTLNTHSPWGVVVGNTYTGTRVATVSPPAHSTFEGVTAAADDATFVLDASTCWRAGANQCPRAWYLLRLSPTGSGAPAPLTRLPIPPTASGTEVQGIALSPDGRELAVALQPPGSVPETLSIYSVATGAVLHSWTGPSDTIAYPYPWARADSDAVLFWSADGRTLSFRNEMSVRTVRTSGPGHDLIADSKLIWSYQGSQYAHGGYQLSCFNTPIVVSDGTTLVCGASGVPLPSAHVPSRCSAMWDNTRGFLAYSTSAPEVARALYIGQTTCTSEVTAEVLWSSPGGSALFVWLNSAPISDPAGPQTNMVGMISGGVFTQTPFPLNGGEAIPNQVAW